MNADKKQRLVVAAFDFDGTLTKRDTLMPFLARCLGRRRFGWVLLKTFPWLAGHAVGLVQNHVAKQKLFVAALQGRSMLEIDSWADCWLAQDFPAQHHGWAMERLAWHQAQGHCCVIVSASPDIYLKKVALQLRVDGLICTEMDVQGGHLTGLMRTPNCHGEQKVLRLQAWLSDRFGVDARGAELHAYGDTAGDKPMLRIANSAWYRGLPWKG